MRRFLIYMLLLLLLVGCGLPEPVQQTPHMEIQDTGDRRGALVDEIVFTQESDLRKVTELIEAGTHHVFAAGINNPTIFRRIRESSRADYDISYGSSVELTINPAGPKFTDGRINPFHVPEIREALNWLVNRRHVAEEIFGGLAAPRVLPLNTTFPDYARLADTARVLELRYEYDPDRAREVIYQQMEKLGAKFEDGRWRYDGAPMQISVLIRTEDERRRIGDYIANLMEDLGFLVERLYRTAEEASRIWILGDPTLGQWHLYTGAWVSMAINRDLGDNFSYFYTPRGRPEPLWQVYEPGPELDEIADRLQRRDYKTWDERQELMARALELSMVNSARVWLVDQISVWPRAQNVQLAVDLAGGISASAFWPYTLRFLDRLGGRIVFGTPSLLVEPWNPVNGSNWLFDTMMQRGLDDPDFLPDPFTGLYWPQRIESVAVTVEQEVPVIRTHDWLTLETAEQIVVPPDTWIGWNRGEQQFVTIGEQHPEGITARSRTVVRYGDGYLERRWHDGSQISMADFLAGWLLMFERADKESPLYDEAHVSRFEVFLKHYRGWRILSREPLVIEVYSDQIYPDSEWIAAARTPGVSPWHSLAIGMRAERNGELTFSSNKADRLGVDWMNFIAGPSLGILARHLNAARAEGYVPYEAALRPFLRPGEVEARYAALVQWHEQRRHFWVGNGPFYLHSVHPVERSVVMRRVEDFPDRSDKWLHFTKPRIPVVDLDGPLVIPAGQPAQFELEIQHEGEPFPAEEIEMARYMVFDGTGRMVLQGDAVPASESGIWRIGMSAAEMATLGTGANSLEVTVTSRGVALPTFATHGFATILGQARTE